MVCALLSHSYHVTTSCDIMCCDCDCDLGHVILSHTLHSCVVSPEKKYK